jgi:hypothetical protein
MALIIMFSSIFMLSPVTAASSNDQIFQGCSQVSGSPVCKEKNTTTNPVSHIIKVAVSIVAVMTGVAAVIFIIVGGITMITSGGNTESVAKGRKQIISAIIGLVIVALAWSIITFLTNRLIKT